MESRQLIIVIRQFWPHAGPAQLAVTDLASEFLRQGHRVEIVTARMEKNWPRQFELREIPVTRISKPTIGPWSSFRYQRGLAQHLSSIPSPDGIIVFGLDDDIATVSRVLGSQTSIIGRVDYRISPYAQWSGKLKRKTRLGFSHARTVVADSNLTRNWLMRFGLETDQIQVQHDHTVVDSTDERTTATQSTARRGLTDAHPVLAIEPDQTMVVTGAPIDDDGGVVDLVRAWPRVLNSIPNAKLWILGEGPQTGQLWSLIKSLELVYSVILPGYFDDPSEVFRAADLYVHPLRSGRACSYLIRAMAEGLCPIVTSTEFTRQLTQPNLSALRLSSGSPQAMGEAIIHASKEGELRGRLGIAAKKQIETTHSIDRAAKQYLGWFGLRSEPLDPIASNKISSTE